MGGTLEGLYQVPLQPPGLGHGHESLARVLSVLVSLHVLGLSLLLRPFCSWGLFCHSILQHYPLQNPGGSREMGTDSGHLVRVTGTAGLGDFAIPLRTV